MAFEPEMSEALAEFKELADYGREFPDIGQRLSDFLYGGTPAFRGHVDESVTVPTGHGVVVYQLTDGMKALLAAARLRAGKFETHSVPKRMAHG